MDDDSEIPVGDGKIPEMPVGERQNAFPILLMLLAQAYYKMLESAVSMADWVAQLDLELNSSYLWVTENLTNLLANAPELSDFSLKFEPAFPDLYPSTIANVEWEWVAPDAEEFLSAVQRYVQSKKTVEPEEGSAGWAFIEMFRPGVDTSIQRAKAYQKRMSGHVKKMLGGEDKKPVGDSEKKPSTEHTAEAEPIEPERKPPMESGSVQDRVIYVDGERFLLPAQIKSRFGPVTVEQLKRVSRDMRVHVLITGETGTGKESFALHLRDLAEIPDGKWGSVNCASIQPDIADSELFGHVKGAFTGAHDMRPGLLKANEGGAVFLDEIGGLEQATQQKLLRFLNSFELRPVGADRDQKVVTRVFAATNANIEDALIHDLRPRFQFKIELPPLRQRLGDIPWLLNHPNFLGGGRVFTGISWRTLCALMVQEYPENMRELNSFCIHWLTAFPADTYVLDDFSIMGAQAASWAGFASFALAALESYSAENCRGGSKPKSAVELCALLLGMMGDADGAEVPLSIKISDLPQLIDDSGRLFNIQLLHAALCKKCAGFYRPDTDEQFATLGEAVGWLKIWIEVYKNLDEKKRVDVVAQTGMQSLRKRPKGPSEAFLGTLRDSLRKAWRWEQPGPPEYSELETTLDEKGIEGELRRVALYCAEGLSNPQIVAKPDISKSTSWVQEELQKLRSDPRLERLLPVAGPGRKRNG